MASGKNIAVSEEKQHKLHLYNNFLIQTLYTEFVQLIYSSPLEF